MLSCKFCELFNNTFLTKHLKPLHPHQNFAPHHSRLLFDPRHPRHPRHPSHLFWPVPNFMDSHHPTPPTPKFDPRYPRIHAPALPTPPTLFSRLDAWTLFLIKIFMEKSIFILHIFFMHVSVFLNPLLKKRNLCSTQREKNEKRKRKNSWKRKSW